MHTAQTSLFLPHCNLVTSLEKSAAEAVLGRKKRKIVMVELVSQYWFSSALSQDLTGGFNE